MQVDTVSFLTSVSSMRVTKEGSVRVDLVGGTLDLEPINLILPHVVTLNVATSLKARVVIETHDASELIIVSSDYNKTYTYTPEQLNERDVVYSSKYEEMAFVLQILLLFDIKGGLKITLSSGAPAGSGLGGSSAMGVTLFSALCELQGSQLDKHEIVQKVKGVEARILNQGVAGYQDYYPALTGGVLALKGSPGEIQCEQLYSNDLTEFLESHLTLVYSGLSRNSGINNWEVYKGFFDNVFHVRSGLQRISEISQQFYQNLKNKNYPSLLQLIGEEGEARKQLAPGIVPQKVQEFQSQLSEQGNCYGIKMCGAGGGGCFIISHAKEKANEVKEFAVEFDFRPLEFKIQSPLEDHA
ncbi:MAG: hypothetical protein CME62_01995 [Halobacteriovoraceae bacterium]|nr:hypothetical protein [Halobacteriovoraceae bacterium]